MSNRSIGITGTQKGATLAQFVSLEKALNYFFGLGIQIMQNGDCVGVDETAGKLWEGIGGLIHLHPPDNPAKRAYLKASIEAAPLPYLVRNRNIAVHSEILLAVPKEPQEQLRSGTWSTCRNALNLNRVVWIIKPDGTSERMTCSRF